MKPAWDQLGDEFAGSKTVIIADVDCTVEKDLCSKYGVRGYPTIKTFTGNPDGDAYEGGRDFDALKKFADESLGPSCSNDNIDLCDDDQKKILDKYNAMSAGERKKLVDEANKAVEDAEENFKAEVKKLQSQYETLMSDKVRFAAPHSIPRLANRLNRLLSFCTGRGGQEAADTGAPPPQVDQERRQGRVRPPAPPSSSALAASCRKVQSLTQRFSCRQALSSPVWSDGEGEGGGGPQPCARRTRHSRRMTCRPHPGREILAGVGTDERRAPDQ